METSVAFVTLLLLMAYVGFPSKAAKLPAEFELCAKNDPNVDECFRSSIEKALFAMKDGISSLHLLPTDPLAVTRINIQDSPNRPVSINLDLTNVKLRGLKDTKVMKARTNLNSRYFEAETQIPLLTLDSDYIMDGKFLVLPLKGNGKVVAKLHNAQVLLKVQAETETKAGDSYWNVVDFKVIIKDTTRLEVNFGNLFNGDEALGKATNEALNNNWKEFWAELRPSIEDSFGAVFLSVANTILGQVPEKDIFL